MDVKDAARLLVVSAALTGKEPTREQAQAWAVVLDDVPVSEAMDALREHYRVSRFPVMPADILAMVEASREGREREYRRARSALWKRKANAEFRVERAWERGVDPATLSPDDVLWPGVGWDGDDALGTA